MPITRNAEVFPVLTEEERELIGALWRASADLPLKKRYGHIYWEVFPRIASRVAAPIDQQMPSLEQITYAILGEAIEDGLLRSPGAAGMLTEAVYYEAGGSDTLQERGRFCFCPDRVRYSFRPQTRHASACDGLWQAFRYTAFHLLDCPRSLLTYGKPYLFLDLTTVGGETCEMEETVALQQALADWFHLDIRSVKHTWLAPGQFEPLPPDDHLATEQQAQRALERIASMLLERDSTFVSRALIPVMEHGASHVVSGCLSLLQQNSALMPFLLEVGWEHACRWYVLDPVYGEQDPFPACDTANGAGDWR